MQSAAIEVYGANCNPQEYLTPDCDMHCPDIGTSGLNFWKDRCELRQDDPQQKTCYGGCRYERTKDDNKSSKPKKKLLNKQTFRRAILKLFEAGSTKQEIADMLGIQENEVYNTIRREKYKLKKLEETL